MALLHPQLRLQLHALAYRIGRAAVPDDATLRGEAGDTLMTDSTATQPRTKGDELYAAGSTEITWVMVDLILAIALLVLIGSLIGGLL
jgi:hypothetical protein